ncbi:hypothetical protein GOBAR_AA28849 [Gossypium barbadense]|uniref:Uncharacterized protein n=1 Tax=Gossypium barbadense TaxID=3634 RepID=A0A2P5WLA0_GOSBA|nr:hypothetical protein GOBAR_AA28849 [Gossypium barbadense]
MELKTCLRKFLELQSIRGRLCEVLTSISMLDVQTNPIIIEIDAHSEDEFYKNGHFNHECEDFSDPDVHDVPDDIDNE